HQAPLAERRLMDVKLQDMPAWLATCNLSPQGVLGATCRAWNRYYKKYINVKKGGVAGISMLLLLLGYCVLSYTWSYKHIKHSRWRKYH
ncbi:ATP synthase subunit f, mitochondrial-like, partial [Varanus komodoensis]|uniref:ATP synthase subunit f, mitochondrial-like n=1 Tax=Varanus komodoensis TaxID=61221 RepID=UPI001CF77B9F